MKKSTFVTGILGTVSGILFAIGMCMAMLPEWNAFTPGVVLGCVGLVLALITVFVWRKMTRKEKIQINGKTILVAVLSVLGALGLGVGMCLVTVWGHLVFGIIVGMVGLMILFSLIPITKGIHE